MLLQQAQARNPKMANQISQAMNSGTNPRDFMKQMMGNATSQQMQNVLTQAKNMGVPDEVLNQVQNMK
jgi:hypothetical protein